MKLPTIQYTTGVTPLAKRNVQMGFAEAAPGLALTEQVGVIAKDMYKRETEIEVKKKRLFEQRELNDFEAKYKNQRTISADELISLGMEVPDVGTRKDIVDGQIVDVTNDAIPMYMVYPDMIKQKISLIKEASSGMVFDKRTSQNEQMRFDEASQALLHSAVMDSQKKQIHHDIAMDMTNYKIELENGNAKLAEHIARNMNVADEKKMELVVNAQRRDKTDFFDQLLETRNIPGMKLALEGLVNPKVDSPLTQPQETAYANRFRSALYSAEQGARGRKSAMDKLYKDEILKNIEMLNAGETVPLPRLNKLMEIAPSVDPVAARDLYNAVKYQPKAAHDAMLNINDQVAMLAQLEMEPRRTAFDTDEYKRRKASITKNIRDLTNDSYDYAITRNYIQHEPIDPNNIVLSLKKRDVIEESIRTQFGHSTGFVSRSEATEWASRRNNMSDAEGAQFDTAVYAGLGDKAGAFYEQLGFNGLSSEKVMAGQLGAQGAINVSREVLNGRQVRKDLPDVITPLEALAKIDINNAMGNAFEGASARQAALTNAILDVAANDLNAAGKNMGVYDGTAKGIIENAINKVTGGGFTNFNGSTVMTPDRQTSAREFSKWLEDFDKSHIDNLGGAYGITSAQLTEGIQDGRYRLIDKGLNRYYVIGDMGAIFRNPSQTAPFVFRYDPHAEMAYDVERKARQKRKVEGTLTPEEEAMERVRKLYQ